MQNDVVDVLPKDGLEIQLVRRVKIGGHRLRVAVDHDGLVTTLFRRQHAVHTAIVKFDALSNAVGAAAQHHNFLFVRNDALVGRFLKGAVVVRSQGREFGRAGVDQLVHPRDAFRMSTGVHLRLETRQNVCNLTVGISLAFGFPEHRHGDGVNGEAGKLSFKQHQLLDLSQEPRIDFGGLEDASERNAQFEGIVHVEQTVPTGIPQAVHDRVLVPQFAAIGAQAIPLQLEGLACLLQCFLERSADGHHLAHGLHLEAQHIVTPREFVKVPTWDFHHNVVQRGLKHRRGVPSDLVFELVQVVTNGQLRRNLGNRVTRGFGGQSRRPRNPRVDFNGNDVLVFIR